VEWIITVWITANLWVYSGWYSPTSVYILHAVFISNQHPANPPQDAKTLLQHPLILITGDCSGGSTKWMGVTWIGGVGAYSRLGNIRVGICIDHVQTKVGITNWKGQLVYRFFLAWAHVKALFNSYDMPSYLFWHISFLLGSMLEYFLKITKKIFFSCRHWCVSEDLGGQLVYPFFLAGAHLKALFNSYDMPSYLFWHISFLLGSVLDYLENYLIFFSCRHWCVSEDLGVNLFIHFF